MLIRNYGLFWKADDVFWGKPGVIGHLKGVLAKSVTTEPVDFRLQQGVYVLYDDNFKLLYVGQAGASDNQRLFTRLKQHMRDNLNGRWTKFSWFGIRGVENGQLTQEATEATTTNSAVLNHIEAILIASAEPPHNRQGGRFGEDVSQYLQHKDEALGPKLEDMIREIWAAKS